MKCTFNFMAVFSIYFSFFDWKFVFDKITNLLILISTYFFLSAAFLLAKELLFLIFFSI